MLPTTTSPVCRPTRDLEGLGQARQPAPIFRHEGLDVESGAHCPLSIVLMGDGRAEEGQHAIPQELDHGATILLDRLD